MAELPHKFDINCLKTVACWFNKVETGVDSIVYEFVAIDTILLLKVCVEAGFYVV